MKVNSDNLHFIDEVAKQIFVTNLTEKFTTTDQFKALAANSYYLATVLADHREDFRKGKVCEEVVCDYKDSAPCFKPEKLEKLEKLEKVVEKVVEKAVEKVEKEEPKAKLHKFKAPQKQENYVQESYVQEKQEKPATPAFEAKAVASSEFGDIVQKRKRGRPPKVKTEAVSLPIKKK